MRRREFITATAATAFNFASGARAQSSARSPGLTECRMPLHDQISSFDKPELVQFGKVSLKRRAFRELGGNENGNAFCYAV